MLFAFCYKPLKRVQCILLSCFFGGRSEIYPTFFQITFDLIPLRIQIHIIFVLTNFCVSSISIQSKTVLKSFAALLKCSEQKFVVAVVVYGL